MKPRTGTQKHSVHWFASGLDDVIYSLRLRSTSLRACADTLQPKEVRLNLKKAILRTQVHSCKGDHDLGFGLSEDVNEARRAPVCCQAEEKAHPPSFTFQSRSFAQN